MGFRELVVVILLTSHASSTCYYRDGTIARGDKPCPKSNICCASGDTCMDNLLCRDKHNFANKSAVTFPGGVYNFTDLYHTSSCQSQSYDGCSIQCTTYTQIIGFLVLSDSIIILTPIPYSLDDSYSGGYIWACNSALTNYCCHSGTLNLSQYDCCQNGTFSLVSPSQSKSTTAATISTTTTTSSSTPSISTSDDSFSATATNTIEPDPSSSLSTGAKAGIGVGLATAAIVAIGLVVLVCARRKKEKARTSEKALTELPSDLSNRQGMNDTTRPSESVLGQGVHRVYELGS